MRFHLGLTNHRLRKWRASKMNVRRTSYDVRHTLVCRYAGKLYTFAGRKTARTMWQSEAELNTWHLVSSLWWSLVTWTDEANMEALRCLDNNQLALLRNYHHNPRSIGSRATTCALCTLNVQYTLYTVQCTEYTVHCIVYTVYCTMYSLHRTLYIV